MLADLKRKVGREALWTLCDLEHIFDGPSDAVGASGDNSVRSHDSVVVRRVEELDFRQIQSTLDDRDT